MMYGIKNSIFEIIYFVINIFANLIIRKILIENIHIEVVALNQVLTQIINVVSLVEFGISKIMFFFLYPALKENDKSSITNIMSVFKKKYLLIACVFLSVGLIFVPFLSFFVNDFVFPINYIFIYLIMLVQNMSILLFSYKKYLLQADQKSYIYLKIMIFFKFIYLLIAYLTIKLTKNSYLYFVVCCVCEGLTYYIISKVVDKKYSYITNQVNDKSNLYDKEIMKQIKSTGVSKIFGELSRSIDIFVLSFLSNGYMLGLYSNYFSIFNSLYWVILKIFDSFKATVAKFIATSSLKQSYQVFKLFDLCSYIIGFLSSFVFYYTIDFIISLWIGKEYILGGSIPLMLSIQLFLYIYRMSLWYTVNIKGWFYISKISDFIGTTINLILSIILYFRFDITGIIIATIISQIIQYIIEDYFILNNFNSLNVKAILEKLFLIGLYAILLFFVVYKNQLSILIAAFVIVFLGFLFKRRCMYVFKGEETN